MHIPGFSYLKHIRRHFSPLEWAIFLVLCLTLFISVVGILEQLQDYVSTEVPTSDGEIHLGVVGTPRYANPPLARTDADKTINQLVYAGLTRISADGTLELDLAQEMERSEDGTSYTFTIRDDAIFSDGQSVTARDVAYTVEMIQNQQIGSPEIANWSGIGIEIIDQSTISFTLEEPFVDFPFNTTIGILPAHYWQNVSPANIPFANQNTRPIGAGNFTLDEINRNDNGIIQSYQLSRRENGTGHIAAVTVHFFDTEAALLTALETGNIDTASGVTPQNAVRFADAENFVTHTAPLNRVFAVFFNQNDNQLLTSAPVREALSTVVDKQAIVDAALSGYGTVIDGPLPAPASSGEASAATASSSAEREDTARELLEVAGWSENESGELSNDGEILEITLTTGDIPALRRTAEIIAERWRELGVVVTTEFRSPADLSGQVIRPRNYEALLFGQSINRGGDLYPFWHSSAQSDPGLNLAMYANQETDSQLENLRQAEDERIQLQREIAGEIAAEQPALFLYTPDFILISDQRVAGIKLPPITSPEDRLAGFKNWYTGTHNLWDIFLPNSTSQNKSETAEIFDTSTTSATSSNTATTSSS